MTSKKALKPLNQKGIQKVKKKGTITEYRLENGLRVLYAPMRGRGVVTTNIVYRVGARDEARGETGLAHMLEHMLFKPTTHDIKRKTGSAATLFERSVGCELNATTCKERTNYYFSYPVEHFERALRTEAERMRDVVLTDAEFLPERTNVLSEFDMYAGDEEFALAVQMMGVAFQSHPYGHETIGYREDIERYTVDMLDRFYKTHYAPNNATLVVVGDVSEREMLDMVGKHFGHIAPSVIPVRRESIEPKQEGERRVTVKRPTSTNALAFGVLHPGFPHVGWFETMAVFEVLAGGEDSVLHKLLVDTGTASAVKGIIEPFSETSLGYVFVTLAPGVAHEDVYAQVHRIVSELTVKDIAPHLKKMIARAIVGERVGRERSLGFASELTEYVSADAWEHFFETEAILRSITPRAVHACMRELFYPDRMTIGTFIGTQAS